MVTEGGVVLILGSGPHATACQDWERTRFQHIVAINNAWRLRPDWDYLIHPDDFPTDRMPQTPAANQRIIGSADYVPAQNLFGGFVYGGGTMAFTAGYWALSALRPRVLAYFGCDMVYPKRSQTHFYGSGTADPLRDDPTLQSLEAKSARLYLLAARQGCACVNLSMGPSRLVFPRVALAADPPGPPKVPGGPIAAEEQEQTLGYSVPSGRYWEEAARFDSQALARIDALWLDAYKDIQAIAAPLPAA